jgi:hypothetical protein
MENFFGGWKLIFASGGARSGDFALDMIRSVEYGCIIDGMTGYRIDDTA